MTDAAANRPLRIFLCHATNDKPAVRDLYRRLTTDGLAPWLDEEDLLPGQKWRDEIPKAVRNSDVVLVCLSQHSINKTGYVQKEIKFALDAADEQPDGTIFLIPLRLEECDVPDRLSHLQWVNFYDDDGYARLFRALLRRATDLNAYTPSISTEPISPLVPAARDLFLSSVSGGVTLKSVKEVNIGGDVTGRDKIIQVGTYIEHAMIIQSGLSVQEIEPTTPTSTDNRRIIGGLEFVRVSAGQFIMGSKDGSKLAYVQEHPQHTFEIPYDYWIARFVVTNNDFARFIEATRYVTMAERKGGWNGKVFEKGYDWLHPQGAKSGVKNNGDHPVVHISWHDAMTYCQWLNVTLHSGLVGMIVRLPTEAEWEKAARGEYGNEWPWGNEWEWGKCNSHEARIGGTTPVDAYSPQGDSPYGVADMAGNVCEWTVSLWGRDFNKPDFEYPYKRDDGREKIDAPNSVRRVMRGGSFAHSLGFVRTACRIRFEPDARLDCWGFRVVIAPPLPG